MMGSRVSCIPSSASQSRALSLLSSRSPPWISTSDLSSRSSAALCELIAENRASILAKQLLAEHTGWHGMNPENHLMFMQHHQHQLPSQLSPHMAADGWNSGDYSEAGRQVTLDLMQTPGSLSFEMIRRRNESKEGEDDCCDIWKSF